MDRKEREAEQKPSIAETLGHVETREPDFPELTKIRAFDRQMHIQKALEMGMSREEAEAHAHDALSDREEGQ